MTTCLIAYGLLLIALFHILPAGGLFFAVSIFLAGSVAAGLIEYRENILSLKAGLNSQIEKIDSEKNRLTNEVKGSDDYISELKNKEAALAAITA